MAVELLSVRVCLVLGFYSVLAVIHCHPNDDVHVQSSEFQNIKPFHTGPHDRIKSNPHFHMYTHGIRWKPDCNPFSNNCDAKSFRRGFDVGIPKDRGTARGDSYQILHTTPTRDLAATRLDELSTNSSQDGEALLAFKSGIEADPLQQLSSWNLKNVSNLCTWNGVNCSASGRVVSLELQEMVLTGSISRSLGNLSFLVHLDLSSNQLRGSVPAELGMLDHLQTLILSDNVLTGQIPSELGRLRKLQELLLSSNTLTGSIPTALGNCSALKYLHLSENSLTGEIWPVLQNFKNLCYLSVHHNGFSGRLQLFDTVPNLAFLDVSSNHLHGPIPEPLYNCSGLKYVLISYNSLSGRISSAIGKLGALTVFFAASNNFTGSLPSELKNLTRLTHLSFSNNNLSGSIGTFQFSSYSSLLALDISHNHFVGQFPRLSGMPNIIVLKASYNNFEGEIPSEVWQLRMLQVLDLSDNEFIGSIPTNLTGLVGLTNPSQESIDECFDLEFPTELATKGTISSFTYIRKDFGLVNLSGNRLSGSIPIEIRYLKGLRDLNLSRNVFTGNIPSTLESLTSLESLDLSQNSFEGSIPLEICEIDGLGTLKLFKNNLSGYIPTLSSVCQTKLGDYELLPGNDGLCGPPVNRICSSTPTHILHSDSSHSTEWMSWQALSTGFLIGYLVMGLMLLFSPSVRHVLFMLVPVPTGRRRLEEDFFS